MAAVDRAMYRLGRRLIDRFIQNDIPFTGVLGLAANADVSADPASFLRTHVNNLNDPKVLGIAERQLDVLLNTEDEVRERLAKFARAMRDVAEFQTRTGCPTTTALYGCRLGMSLVTEEICQERDPLGLAPDEHTAEDDERRVEEAAAMCGASPTVESFLETMRSLKYKYEPFEWVYEGLDPIMMRTILHCRTGPGRKKCTPAALALALATVGERAGLKLLPMPAFAASQAQSVGAAKIDLSILEGLSDDALLRMRSKTQAVAPEPSTWLLRVVNDGPADGPAEKIGDRGEIDEKNWIDCKQGSVVGEDEVAARFPGLADYDVARWRAESVLKTWQGLVDLAIQAHTRRGESDAVANWLYVKLALDVFALEWERALEMPEIAV